MADITCLDYSQDMLEQAESRLRGAGITNIKTMQGDVGALPFVEGTFDKILLNYHKRFLRIAMIWRFFRIFAAETAIMVILSEICITCV